MSRMRVFAFASMVCGVGLASFAGCGSNPIFDTTLTPIEGGPNDDSGFVLPGGDAGQTGMGVACAPDLQTLLDKDGNVVGKCQPDQGCLGGTCLPACQAANAGKGSLGCTFVVSTPNFWSGTSQPCFAMFVANTWPKAAQISVTRAGKSYNVTQFGRIPNGTNVPSSWAPVPSGGLPVGEVAVLFLSDNPASTHPIGGPMVCPVTPAVTPDTTVSGTGRGQAFQITSDVPLTAYDIHPFGGARSFLPSAQLLLPTNAWGNNFVAASPLAGQSGHWGQIVAVQSGTTVDVVPSIALPSGGGLPAAAANTKTTFTLAAGEFINWENSGDMSGTIISSNYPIAFQSGARLQCLSSSTSSGGGCDSTHQGTPPVQALGSEYAVAPYATRRADMQEEATIYRIVGTVAGTTLTYDPPIGAAPASLTKGQVLSFEGTGGFTVKSQDAQHPFYIGQAMTGCNVAGGSRPGITQPPPFGLGNCLGDEDYVVVLPPAQFMQNYVFFTDPTYATTNLSLTRVKTASGFKDVSVGCLGNVTGWKPIGKSGMYEQTNVDLVRANKSVGNCKNGGQTAKSDGRFGVTVWGLDVYASYGYPAGGNAASINTVIVPPVPN